MNKTIQLCLILFLICSCSGEQKKKEYLILFAASSLTNVVQEMAEDFENKTGVKVKLNIASSGILARQIESGANFDYYISANKNWMQYADSLHLVSKASIQNLASNRLVAIVPVESKCSEIKKESIRDKFPELFKGRLSIGDPKHVPAGKYAMQSLEFYGWNNKIAERILPAKNARDALLMVELGEVEMGIVYKTDAEKSDKVKIVYTFPQDCYEPIHYIGAAKEIKSKKSKQFLLYIQSAQAKEIWKKNGFNIE